MPLTNAQIAAISKVEGGTEILDQIETDIKDGIEKELKPLKDEKAKIIRENVERKRIIQDLEAHLQTVGLDPKAPLEEQLTALTEKLKGEVSKNATPNKEVDAIRKEMESMKKKIEASDLARVAAENMAKTEKVKSHFAPKLADHFGDNSELVLENGMTKGLFTVDESGNPCVKVGDEFFTGDQALNSLRQLYPKQAITRQKGGAGDTAARGGQGGAAGKTMTTEEYNAKVIKGEDVLKFFADGGQIAD